MKGETFATSGDELTRAFQYWEAGLMGFAQILVSVVAKGARFEFARELLGSSRLRGCLEFMGLDAGWFSGLERRLMVMVEITVGCVGTA